MVNLVIDRPHGLGIQVNDVKAWWLPLIRRCRTSKEIDAIGNLRLQVSHDLQLMLMNVRIHTETNGMREAIHNGSKTMTKLEGAFLKVWQMSQNDGCAIHLLELFELVNQPLQLVGRVVERSHRVPVLQVANVGIYSQNARFVI